MSVQMRFVLAILTALPLMSCDNSISAPEPGGLRVSVSTTGEDPDVSYEIAVDSRHRAVGASTSFLFDSLTVGPHALSLEGVAENCTIKDAPPNPITIESGLIANARFGVACEATGIEVTIHTTGVDSPPDFEIGVGTNSRYVVGSNGTLRVTRLDAGESAVSVYGIPSNCAAAANPVKVAVINRRVAATTIEIACVEGPKVIAFAQERAQPYTRALWITTANADGSIILPIVQGTSPAWSPDGTRIAFSDIICEDSYSYYYYYEPWCYGGIRILDMATRGVSTGGDFQMGKEPSWSPDGKLLVFSRSDSRSFTFIFTASIDGSDVHQVATPGEAWNPAWAPDGQRIAFECSREGSETSEICIINKDGSGFIQLTNNAFDDRDPAWSPDGKTIAFSSNASTAGYQISLIAPSGGSVSTLTSGREPAWSPDGSRLVFTTDATVGLFTIRVDGTGLKRLTTGRHYGASWRP